MTKNRSEIVDWIFWIIIFTAIIALTGIYRTSNSQTFLKWITFTGLAFDAIGALLLGSVEISKIHRYMWPSVVSAKGKLTEQREELGPDHPGFEGITEIFWDRFQPKVSEIEESEVDIRNFEFYAEDIIFARGDNGNQMEFGSQNQIDTWTIQKIAKWTRDKVTPYALFLLFTGFTLQLISYWLQNF